MRVSIAALASMLGLSGCALYFDEDPGGTTTDAGPQGTPDARQGPDPRTDCAIPLPCPAPASGRFTVCGQIRRVVDDDRVGDNPAGTCNPDVAGDGVCSLDLRVYDALDLAGDPFGAQELPSQGITIDGCGRFVAVDVQRPGVGYAAVAVEDKDGATDLHRLTWSAFPVAAGQRVVNPPAYVISRATDEAWSAAAGLDPTFVDRGAMLFLFRRSAGPASGVQVTVEGAAAPQRDSYFADTVATSRAAIDPALPRTGPNGTALIIGSPLVDHSGEGGEPAGCNWETALAAAVPGTLGVTIRHPIDADGERCD